MEKDKEKESLIKHFKSLLDECKNLRRQLSQANCSLRTSFHAWIKKRQKMELTENQCFEVELDYFDKTDLQNIMKIICEEILKLIPPRKRKHAKDLLISFRLPSKELTWEKLNSVSSGQSLPIGQKNQCSTCNKKISWWNFFSKQIDEVGNQFCSQKCYSEFHDLICDKCNTKILDSPHYIDKDKEEGIVCFDCANTECLECRKIIPHSFNYLQKTLPGPEGEKEWDNKSSYLPYCKSCQAKIKH